ncbi:hypothetical protein D7193_22405 [Micromonospora costi]|uniref:Uncharacterized protein n=1 Tax=Micromonospora costi TaxID=1530042 RepID=A0A3A9ZYY0_9ACTN|nr:hypothetical protein D7193_22405 [Micromonospora costi]
MPVGDHHAVPAVAGRRARIRGVDDVLRRAAEHGALPFELGVPWAVGPFRFAHPGTPGGHRR